MIKTKACRVITQTDKNTSYTIQKAIQTSRLHWNVLVATSYKLVFTIVYTTDYWQIFKKWISPLLQKVVSYNIVLSSGFNINNNKNNHKTYTETKEVP